jgi:hypothetical protein
VVKLADGTMLGPMTEPKVVELIGKGVISGEDLIQRVGSARWRKVIEVAGRAVLAAESEADPSPDAPVQALGKAIPTEPEVFSEWLASAATDANALPEPPNPPTASRRTNHISWKVALAVVLGVVGAGAVFVPLFRAQIQRHAADEYNQWFRRDGAMLIAECESGEPPDLLRRIEEMMSRASKPAYALDDASLLLVPELEKARSRVYWSTRRLEPDFAKVDALAREAMAMAAKDELASARKLVEQARQAMPDLPTPLPATIDANRAREPLDQIAAVEAAIEEARLRVQARISVLKRELEGSKIVGRVDLSGRNGGLGISLSGADVAACVKVVLLSEGASQTTGIAWASVLVGRIDQSIDQGEELLENKDLVGPARRNTEAALRKQSASMIEVRNSISPLLDTLAPQELREKLASEAVGRSLCGFSYLDIANLMFIADLHNSSTSELQRLTRAPQIKILQELSQSSTRHLEVMLRQFVSDYDPPFPEIMKPGNIVAVVNDDGTFSFSNIKRGSYVLVAYTNDDRFIVRWIKPLGFSKAGEAQVLLNYDNATIFARTTFD